jgi:hypothetical protein
MKHLYFRFFSVTILLLLATSFTFVGHSQCADGQPSGQTAYDTTIVTGSGIVSTEVKFPKFDPASGMVTCVRLCVTIRGIIDTVSLENFTNAPQTGSYSYNRRDTIKGPGIPTQLSSTSNLNFGPFPLSATNGIMGSGPDLYTQGSDTVLTRVLCANISDSTTIAQFYGTNDSVTYTYAIDANAVGVVTGGSSLAFVLSSAIVNFRFEYCTCPPVILPLNIRQFNVTKLTSSKAELKWSASDDPYGNYYYEAQVSKDGYNFTTIAVVAKNSSNSDPYRVEYLASHGNGGTYYFRIKQVYPNGSSKYSSIRQLDLENSDFPKFTLYPNPTNGIVGIKFDNIYTGRLNIQIFNAQGQMMVKKDFDAVASSYLQVASLETGVYWLRVSDLKSQKTSANQLLIK